MTRIRVASAVTCLDKAIFARIKPGTDLMEGIESICRRHAVRCGFVVSGIGSLARSSFVYVVPDEQARTGASYEAPQHVDGPLELLGLQGTIGEGMQNEVCVHVHATMTGADMRVCGGHLISSQNPVLATAEVMIFPAPDIRMVRAMDPETGFELFNPAS